MEKQNSAVKGAMSLFNVPTSRNSQMASPHKKSERSRDIL